MVRLRIRLFGRPSIESDGRPVQAVEGRKAQELLGYLLLFREHPQSREHMASLLWADVPTSQAKAYLRKAIWQLQSQVDGGRGGTRPHLLLGDDDWLQINPSADYWLDTDILKQSFQLVEGILGENINPVHVETVQVAIDVYRGALLEDCYEDWCLFERERFEQAYLALLDKLMGYCEVAGEYERGLGYGTSILRHEPAREQTHRRLMRLRALAGDRTGALRQYARCQAILLAELDIPPAPATTTLYEQIRGNHYPITTISATSIPLEITDTTVYHQVIERLQQMLTLLAGLQIRLQEEKLHLERMIHRHPAVISGGRETRYSGLLQDRSSGSDGAPASPRSDEPGLHR